MAELCAEFLGVGIAAHSKGTNTPILAGVAAAPTVVLVGGGVDAPAIAAYLRELAPLPARPTVLPVRLHIHTLLVAALPLLPATTAALGLACFWIIVAPQPGSLP